MVLFIWYLFKFDYQDCILKTFLCKNPLFISINNLASIGIYSSSSTIFLLFLFYGTLNLPLLLQIYSIRSIIWFKYTFLYVINCSSFLPLLPLLSSTPFQDRDNGRVHIILFYFIHHIFIYYIKMLMYWCPVLVMNIK